MSFGRAHNSEDHLRRMGAQRASDRRRASMGQDEAAADEAKQGDQPSVTTRSGEVYRERVQKAREDATGRANRLRREAQAIVGKRIQNFPGDLLKNPNPEPDKLTLAGLVFEVDVVSLLPAGRYAIAARAAVDASGDEYNLELVDIRGLTKVMIRNCMKMTEDQASAYRKRR